MTMRLLHVDDYNAQQRIKYTEKCKEWEPNQGGFPQATFYFFTDKNGNMLTDGFIAYDDKKAIFAPTIIGAKRRYNKMNN